MPIDASLERRLRDAFARSAAEAPLRWPAPGEPPLFTVGTTDPAQNRPRRRSALLVGAAAATVALLVAVRQTRQDATPIFQPIGTEVPLTQVAPPDPGVPVKPGSLVGVQVPGHPAVAMFTTLGWQDGRVVEHRCTWSNGGSACIPTWSQAPELSATSTVDNGDGQFDLVTWSDVPDGAVFVSWSSPSGPLWQRPVAGFAGFPVTTEIGDAPLVAYDADGNVIDAVDQGVYSERLRASDRPGGWQTDPANPELLAIATTDNLSPEQRGELWTLATATVGACLDEPGATWYGCVAETEAVVDARFAAMGGEIVPYVPPTPTGEPEPDVSPTTAPG